MNHWADSTLNEEHSGKELEKVGQYRQALDRILYQAIKDGCSDVHMTAQGEVWVRNKVGDLVPMVINGKPFRLTPGAARETILSCLGQDENVNSRRRLLQELIDARELDLAYTLRTAEGEERFRINLYHTLPNQLRAAFRWLPSKIRTVQELGLPANIIELAQAPRGLVLVCGPTGSGKSTTLASMIDYINKTRHAHIITIEDPVEYIHKSQQCLVSQREVGKDTNSFARALRAALREDPDVILVGEMRDPETISLAITAAETGHLVLSTLHTQDASQTIDRIIDSFPAAQQNQIRAQLSLTLVGVVVQTLLRKRDGTGRTVACEVMTGKHPVPAQIRDGKTHLLYGTIQTGKANGMQTMEQALAELVAKGTIDVATAFERTSRPDDLQLELNKFGQVVAS